MKTLGHVLYARRRQRSKWSIREGIELSLKTLITLTLGAIVSSSIPFVGAVGDRPALSLYLGDDVQSETEFCGQAELLGRSSAGVSPSSTPPMVSVDALAELIRQTVRSELRAPDIQSGARDSGDEKLTVRHYYELRMQATREQTVARGTQQLDRLAVARWERYGRASEKSWRIDNLGRTVFDLTQERRIENPPLEWITDEDLKEFVAAMQTDGLSARSINQTLRHLSVIFEHAGPRSSSNRSGKGVMAIVPHCDPVPEDLQENFIPTDEQVVAFAKAACSAKWPRRPTLTPAQWWLGFLTFELNHGLRLGDLTNLTWDAFESDLTAFEFVARKTERKRPHPMRFPTSEVTRTALKPLSECGEKRCFFGLATRRSFESEWERCLTEIGFTETYQDSEQRQYWTFDRHCLRRYCSWRYNELHAQFPGEFLCGHAFSDSHQMGRRNQVNAKSYSKIYEAPAYVAEAIRTHPLPDGLSELIEQHCVTKPAATI